MPAPPRLRKATFFAQLPPRLQDHEVGAPPSKAPDPGGDLDLWGSPVARERWGRVPGKLVGSCPETRVSVASQVFMEAVPWPKFFPTNIQAH